MERLARWCFRRRRRVLVGWVVLAVGFSIAGSVLLDEYRMDVSLPGTEADDASRVLAEGGFAERSGFTGQIVFASDTGLADPANRAVIDDVIAAISVAVPDVGVVGPFDPDAFGQVSADATVAFAEIDFGDIGLADATELADQVRAARNAATIPGGVAVELGGDLFAEEAEFSSEAFGMLAAVVILLIAFGSVLAMGLPIVTALFGIACGFALVSIGTNVFDIADFTPAAVSMIAIGVGIDYALFIVTRYREELHAGSEPEQAVSVAMNTAGRAVAFAGATVVVSLLGLLFVGLASIQSLAFAAAAAVLMVMLASLTLLPALLGFIGTRIDRFGLPHRRRHHRPTSFGYRWSRMVQRHAPLAAIVGVFVLVALAVPAATMRLGFGDAANRPSTDTSRRAYDLIAEGFGPGHNGPLFLAVTNPTEVSLARLDEILTSDPGVAAVAPSLINDPGDVALVQVFPTTSPQAEATSDLVERIRQDHAPGVEAESGTRVLVGGSVAAAVDFADLQARRLPVFITIVLVLSLVLLVTTFRSVLVPLKAIVMNLVSIGAAYGLTVAVLQHGWGADLLGVEPGPIEAWVPMMLFAIVFGLSMDYEVFLLSRIKEEHDRTGDNTTAVADGLAATARLITAAAAIMVCVFGGFVLSADRSLQLFGFGLAAAVAIDATIVRLLLVPATMELLGERNWWLPRALDRALPHIHIEAPQPAGTTKGVTR